MFRLTLDMRPTTLIFSALAMLVVAYLSQRPGLAAIRRMDLTGSSRTGAHEPDGSRPHLGPWASASDDLAYQHRK